MSLDKTDPRPGHGKGPLSPGPTTNALGVSMKTPVGPGVKGKRERSRLDRFFHLGPRRVSAEAI
jgi:hypothetical protein